MRMNKLILMAAVVVSFTASNAWSECLDTGPAAGITSGDGCTSEIELVVSNLVVVKNLDNIGLGTYDTGSTLTGTDNFCIGTNAANVNVSFNGANEDASGFFNLIGDTNSELIPYDVTFNDGTTITAISDVDGTSTETVLTSNVEDLSCASTPASITVTVDPSDVAVSADTYRDIITVTVSPN